MVTQISRFTCCLVGGSRGKKTNQICYHNFFLSFKIPEEKCEEPGNSKSSTGVFRAECKRLWHHVFLFFFYWQQNGVRTRGRGGLTLSFDRDFVLYFTMPKRFRRMSLIHDCVFQWHKNSEQMDFIMLRNSQGIHAPLRLQMERTTASKVRQIHEETP